MTTIVRLGDKETGTPVMGVYLITLKDKTSSYGSIAKSAWNKFETYATCVG